MKSKLIRCVALLVALCGCSAPLLAHHGSASYKTDKSIIFRRATVTKFVWANPHAMLLFDVRDGQGNVLHWAGEAGSPSAIRQLGWNKRSVQPGDVVTVELFPAKFESNVGRLDCIILPDGSTLKNSPRGDHGVISEY